MKFLKKLFKRKDVLSSNGDNSMEKVPVDNPLDYRENGSIREGDPAWDFMMKVMESDGGGIANQNADGTWTTDIKD